MFDVDIILEAKRNENFRKVMLTGEHTQLVVMSLRAGEDIGRETHHENDQILYIVHGQADIEVGDESRHVAAGELVVVPAGSPHNVTNAGETPLKIVTIYGPPDHAPGTVHATKADARGDEGPPEQ